MNRANFAFTEFDNIDKKEHLFFRVFVFLGFFVLLNFFVLSSFYSFFNLNRGFEFGFLLVFLSLSYVLGAGFLRVSNSFFARSFSIFGSVWLGFIFISSFFLGLLELLVFVGFVPFDYKFFIGFVLSLSCVLVSLILAGFTFNKSIVLSSSKILKPLVLVQISDLHIGAAHTKNFLKNIVDRVIAQKPDVVVITGDLIDGKHVYEEGYFDYLNKIKVPVLMVTGNHERMAGMDLVYSLLENTSVKLLRDESFFFEGVCFVGIDDFDNPRGMFNVLKKFDLDSSVYNVLLYHRPSFFKRVRRLGVDLMLSGHTHAGQIFPGNFILRFFYSKVQGLKKKEGSVLYVSPGTGWWGPPMRLGSHNEITVFRLVPEGS